jgi:chromosome segregation ATPase
MFNYRNRALAAEKEVAEAESEVARYKQAALEAHTRAEGFRKEFQSYQEGVRIVHDNLSASDSHVADLEALVGKISQSISDYQDDVEFKGYGVQR